MQEEEKQEKSRRNPDGTFMPGVSGNPAGHEKGKLNYHQRFRRGLEEMSTWKAPDAIIEQLKKAIPGLPDEVSIDLAERARVHLSALMGEQWAFDRLHDKPGQAMDITTNNESINKVTYNFEGKSPEELRQLRDVLQKAKVNDDSNT